jgi:hypothetical protein
MSPSRMQKLGFVAKSQSSYKIGMVQKRGFEGNKDTRKLTICKDDRETILFG